jgi:hypothetical protein
VRSLGFVQALLREPPIEEGDGQADDEHVNEEPLQKGSILIWAGQVIGAEGQYDQIHYEIYRYPIKQSAHKEMFLQECELQTGEAIDRCR